MDRRQRPSSSKSALAARLKTLARTEEKIREGSCGRCKVCGRPIPAARLQAMPDAVLCVACAEGAPGAPRIGRTHACGDPIVRASALSSSSLMLTEPGIPLSRWRQEPQHISNAFSSRGMQEGE